MKPLAGVRIIVGRAAHQADALSARLTALGAEVLPIPFIEIRKPRSFRPLDAAIKTIASYDWLILTSVNGVDALWERMEKQGIGVKKFAHLNIAAIGPATAKAIQSHRLKVSIVPKEYVAESVVASLKAKVPGKRVLLVRAKVARDVIPRELKSLGAYVDVVEAYETVVPKASLRKLRVALRASEKGLSIVTFTSSSTVRNFATLAGKRALSPAKLRNVRFASIGPVTSATLRQQGLPVHLEARTYTIPGLVEAILESPG